MDPKLFLVFMILGGCLCQQCNLKPQSYFFEVDTLGAKNGGTKGPVHVAVEGCKGTTDFGPIWTDLGRGSVKNFTALGQPTVTMDCIEMTMGTADNWVPNKIMVENEDNTRSYFYSRYISMSSDATKGDTSQKICKQGDTEYTITATTSTKKGANADMIWPSVIINGTNGETETGILFTHNYDDYEKGNTDTYIFPGLKDVGQISCIRVVIRGDGNWLFDSMVVQKKGEDAVTFNSDGVFVDKTKENRFCL